MQGNIPEPGPMSIDDFRDFHSTLKPGVEEIIGWPVFDRFTFVSGTSVEFDAFAQSRTGFAGNMKQGGQFPAGTHFLALAGRLIFKAKPRITAEIANAAAVAASVMDDLTELLFEGTVEMVIGDKRYGRYPQALWPGGAGAVGNVFGVGATAANSNMLVSSASNGVSDPRAVFTFAKPLYLQPLFSWHTELRWPTPALTLAHGDMDIIPVLDGLIIRPQ